MIGLGEAKENYLAFRDQVNDSLRSSRKYEEISLSMPHIADDNEKSAQSLSSVLLRNELELAVCFPLGLLVQPPSIVHLFLCSCSVKECEMAGNAEDRLSVDAVMRRVEEGGPGSVRKTILP